MTSMNISLPDLLREYIDQKVQGGDFSTATEFIRHLVREDRQRFAERQLEAALLEGLDSGEPIEVTEESRDRKRKELLS